MTRVFVVGAPRSGTTWVQLLLAQHPAVATAQETHLFDRYLAPLQQGWSWEKRSEITRGDLGISDLLSEAEFEDLCRTFADRVLARIADRRPDTTTTVEKTPGHVFHARQIRRLFPEAKFVHVVRDPRAVVASVRRAARGWGDWWAPSGILSCTEMWCDHVSAGLEAARDDAGWLLVSYESLWSDCPRTLEEIFEFLGLPSDESLCENACLTCRVDRLRDGKAPGHMPWDIGKEPEGFFGSGGPESWREELNATEVRNVEHVAGELMEQLGYAPLHYEGRRPIASWVRGFLGRIRNGLDRRLTTAIRRM